MHEHAHVRELAASANTAFIPQCGLAPGFVSIVAFDMTKGFEVPRQRQTAGTGHFAHIHSNALNYNLTWSTGWRHQQNTARLAKGDRQWRARRRCRRWRKREEFSLDGVTYEAFNTSEAASGPRRYSLEGKVRTLNYRTIRYPSHVAIMRALLNDLACSDRRDVLKDILEHAVPTTLQDVVIIFVTVSGHKKGHLVQETYANKIYSRDVDGRILSAIQITTAAAICTVLDLLATGQLPQSESIAGGHIAEDFLGERFRPGLRQAGDECSSSTFRSAQGDNGRCSDPAPRCVTKRSGVLSRLRAPPSAFAREGGVVLSPITGELIAKSGPRELGGGERCHRSGH